MAYLEMTRTDFDQRNPNAGAVFSNAISIDSGTYSDVYILPALEVYAITCKTDGDGDLEFTNDSRQLITAGSASYEAWDGASMINPAVTGFRVKRNSGTVTATVTLRTAES